MCPGLTSKGAQMDDVVADKICAIFAEGKQLPLAIGQPKCQRKICRLKLLLMYH